MGKYSAGWITVPGKGKRYRDEAGNYYDMAPGMGRQTYNEWMGNKSDPSRRMQFDLHGMNQDGSLNLRGLPFIGSMENAKREMLGNIGPAVGHHLGQLSWMVGRPPAKPAAANKPATETANPPRPGQPPSPDQDPITPVTQTRNVERAVPGGGVAKGTQTSPSSTPIDNSKGFDQLLAEMGLTDYYNGQAFTSNQLPTTNSNPFSANSTPKTAAFNPQAPGITGNTYDNYGSEGGASAASQPLIDGNEEFNPNAPKIEGGSEAPKSRSMKDALSDTSGMRVDSPEMDKLRARAAFLDADNSMVGLQRAQAIRDKMVYAGGQHYIKDGDGKRAISTDEARSISNGKQTAAGLLQSYKDKITASNAQKPDEVGDSTNPSKSEGSDLFNPGKSADTAGYNPGKGAPLANSQSQPGNPGPAIDFDNNNNQGAPGFDTDEDLLGGSRVRIPLNGGAFGG